ncbi:hypothetical protein [Dactylosporangium salmoneum]|uniref:Uncharacterized protein n=1 Tax=Dactylosporangium salmoneum TaxID=53361 RepID=A0ABP5U5X5_9ACTN
MAQSRSERNPRTASLPAVSRCARYAVRGLIVAGFAGVAWLLSASAAHASDQPELLSPVTSLLTGAGLSGQQNHQQHGDLVTGTVLAVLGPVAKAAPPVTATVTGAVTGTVTLTRAPVQSVDRTARTDRSATADASSAKHASTKRPAKAGILKTHPRRTQEPVVQTEPVRDGSVGDVTAAATGTRGAGVDPAVAARAADRLRALRAAEGLDGAHVQPVADRNVAQGTHHVPLLPRPAPVPAPPAVGLAVGAPGTGSGVNHDGGAAALPAAPAGAKVLTFRPEAVEDVELRLLAAEEPTVSPD